MKEILYMYLENCPYCRLADDMITECCKENSAYLSVPVRKVEESRHSEFAESLDYYYVPCMFVDGQKLLEGIPTRAKIQGVLDVALGKA